VTHDEVIHYHNDSGYYEMPTAYIQISWRSSDEYIDVDLDALPEPGERLETLDYWRAEDERVRYVARCETASVIDGKLTLELLYLAEDNENIAKLDSSWGNSTVVIDLDACKGKATWRDDKDSTRDGVVDSRLLDDSISNDVSYRSTRAIDRLGQALVRQTLLQKFGCCALTGEGTRAVLDVAHLVAASDSGAASIKNCILLRADIHRLMDNGFLSISHDGRAVLRPGTSVRYQEELANAVLSTPVLAHVKQALAKIDKGGWA
jgi:hypothetical protein